MYKSDWSLDACVPHQLQDGQQVLRGSDEWDWGPRQKHRYRQTPERDRSQREGRPRERRPPRAQSEEPQAEMGGEALRHGRQHAEPHQGHRGWHAAHAQRRETHDLTFHR